MKSTVEQIRQRFDNDVERFSSLDVAQTTVIDARLMLDLIAEAAAVTTPQATDMLDVGCGAGNYTLRLLQSLPSLNVTLIDLSQPMLGRAAERIGEASTAAVTSIRTDIRDLDLADESLDIILAAAVLHHLRGEHEWREVFQKMHDALRSGGSLWISDLVEHSTQAIQAMMWQQYGEYLTQLRDDAYRQHVFDYIAQEDTPRSLSFQLDLLKDVGFRHVELLHKSGCFAAFGAMK